MCMSLLVIEVKLCRQHLKRKLLGILVRVQFAVTKITKNKNKQVWEVVVHGMLAYL